MLLISLSLTLFQEALKSTAGDELPQPLWLKKAEITDASLGSVLASDSKPTIPLEALPSRNTRPWVQECTSGYAACCWPGQPSTAAPQAAHAGYGVCISKYQTKEAALDSSPFSRNTNANKHPAL